MKEANSISFTMNGIRSLDKKKNDLFNVKMWLILKGLTLNIWWVQSYMIDRYYFFVKEIWLQKYLGNMTNWHRGKPSINHQICSLKLLTFPQAFLVPVCMIQQNGIRRQQIIFLPLKALPVQKVGKFDEISQMRSLAKLLSARTWMRHFFLRCSYSYK